MSRVGLGIILASLFVWPNGAEGQSAATSTANAEIDNSSAASRQLPRATVYACDFSGDSDANFDGWPDGWSRRQGIGFPKYLKAGIVAMEPTNPRGPQQLRLNLDGGGIQLNSPLFPITSDFDYRLEVDIRTQDLKHHVAFATLQFHDGNRKVLETLTSERITKQDDWRTIRLGPYLPGRFAPEFISIGLHLVPSKNKDLKGAAMFANLKLTKTPRLEISADRKSAVYLAGDEIEVRYSATGMGQSPHVTLRLLDVDERVMDQATFTENTARWSPQVSTPGYYRLVASLMTDDGQKVEQTFAIAIVDPLPAFFQGEFGWSLTRKLPFTFDDLHELLVRSGIHWLKLPIWKEGNEQQTISELNRFAEKLQYDRIQFVAMLDEPGEMVKARMGESSQPTVGSVFADSDLWPSAIEPLLERMAIHVRWWQLGGDKDVSLLAIPDLAQRLTEVRKHVQQFGANSQIGLAWPWVREMPDSQTPLCDFVTRTDEPSLTEFELRSYLSQSKIRPESNRIRDSRWVSIRPLSRNEYPFPERCRDLVARMVAAIMGGVGAAFISDPFEPATGLMNHDGNPGDLYLPFRTTVAQIAGAQYLGSIGLPRGSQNHLLARGDELLMVVWNDREVRETLYLGENVRRIDVWGRSFELDSTSNSGWTTQTIDVGPVPQFITGLDPLATRVRLGITLETPRLDTAVGRPQPVTLALSNITRNDLDGFVELRAPPALRVENRRKPVKLRIGQREQYTDLVRLGGDSINGTQPIQFDFELSGERRIRFSAYANIEIGSGNLTLELAAHMDDNGDLIVEQTLRNHAEDLVNFNCILFVPDRGREWKPVRKLGRGQSINTFIIPQGAELIGKTLWMRAEEIDGDRMLNMELRVEP